MFFSFSNPSLPLPPGPKKAPIVGNLFDVARLKNPQWHTFAEWGKQYKSDIIHVGGLGNSMVILNSYEAAKELIAKRTIYDSRPRTVVLTELGGSDFVFSLMPFGDRWKAARQTCTHHFIPSNQSTHQPHETKHIHAMLLKLLDNPQDHMKHIHRVTESIMMSMIYGITPEDKYLEVMEAAATATSNLIAAGPYLANAIPALKYLPAWLPGAGFKRDARKVSVLATRLHQVPFHAAVEKIKSGEAPASFVSASLGAPDKDEYPEELLKRVEEVAGTIYVGGADTTSSAVATFFLAMVCYPEVQKKAQQELDEVFEGRLPVHGEVSSLPYLSAVIKEVLRWQPVTPIGVPHMLMEEDQYKGYRLPEKSTIIPNQWAMLHDEEFYPDPFEFKPERFLTAEGEIDKDVLDPVEIAFGFGTRICVGTHIALSTLYLAAASALTVFDIQKAVDGNGKEIEPTREYHQAGLTTAEPFPCAIKPRSEEAGNLIRSVNV